MRRRLLILAAFLLAGAVVNVAVAWGCAAWSPLRRQGRTTASEAEFRRLHNLGWEPRAERLGKPPDTTWKLVERSVDSAYHPRFRGLGLRYLLYWDVTTENDRGTPVYVAARVSAGWPMCCLQGTYLPYAQRLHRLYWPEAPMILTIRGSQPFVGARITWGISNLQTAWNKSPIPLGVVWPGFIVNMVFYAVLLWLPFVVRRWGRVRRGLCPKCAYPMGESVVCTECGRALSSMAKPSAIQ